MRNLAKMALLTIVSVAILASATPALAATPFLSVTPQGNGNVQLTVNSADSYSQITLYRRQTTQLWTIITNFGQTNQSGYFSTLTGLSGDGTNNVVEQYVVVNGQQSAVVQTYPNGYSGCSYNCGGSFSLSQTSVSVAAGQSVSVTVNNSGINSAYVSSNSNSSVATVTTNGNTVTVYGVTAGSTTAAICGGGNGTCANLYITVTGNSCYYYNCNGALSFSPSSLNMQVGQNTTVYVQNSGNNNLYLSNNTNTSVVSATISGSSVNVWANNAGTTTLTVCSNSGQCGSFVVTVTGYSNGNGNITFSPSSVSLSSNQSMSVYVYGPNGNNNFYISSNSNSSVATASVSGNTISVYGQGTWGTTSVVVCQTGSSVCGTLLVTVNGYGNGNGGCGYNTCTSPYISNTSLATMTLGQYYSYQLQAYGGTAPYSFSISSGSLPPGIVLSTSGLLYGTPQANQTYNFTVRVNDTYGRSGYTQVSVSSYAVNNNYNGSVLGTSTYNNGQIINENGTVYIVYNNTKTAFGNASAFLGLGFNWGQVASTGYTGLPSSGYIVSTSKAAHPWGSWIKDGGQTVYFVHELGIIPVGDYATFLNNGGSDYRVVKANSYDFQRPILSVMVTSDARLR